MSFLNNETFFTIKSKPDHIEFTCPYCRKMVIVPFDKAIFIKDYWNSAGRANCPECDKEIKLKGYEYD